MGRFDIADAVLSSRHKLDACLPRLQSLHRIAVSEGNSDLFLSDMISLAAATFAYEPDLIIELGRGWGNSTATFGMSGAKVASLCITDNWKKTLALLGAEMPTDWSKTIDAIVGNILTQDYKKVAGDANRVMIFWDAHGYEIADVVLGDILPALAGRDVLVICHDMRDSRYFNDDRNYRGAPLWRGQNVKGCSPFTRIGNIHSSFDQLISILDFTSRNEIPLISATHQLASRDDTRSLYAGEKYWPAVLWHYFEMPLGGRITYPGRGPGAVAARSETETA